MQNGVDFSSTLAYNKDIPQREMIFLKRYIGGWTLSNHGGVGVIEMDSDSMTVQYYDHEPETVEIQYDEDGEAFIQLGELELYLNECMRF